MCTCVHLHRRPRQSSMSELKYFSTSDKSLVSSLVCQIFSLERSLSQWRKKFLFSEGPFRSADLPDLRLTRQSYGMDYVAPRPSTHPSRPRRTNRSSAPVAPRDNVLTPKLVNTGIQLQLHDLADKETIKMYNRHPPEMAWVAVVFLNFTVKLVRPLPSLCMPCVIFAFEKRVVPARDIHSLFKRAHNFIRVLPLAGSAVIFCRMRHRPRASCRGNVRIIPRGARPRTDSHDRRPAHLPHAAALCNATQICVQLRHVIQHGGSACMQLDQAPSLSSEFHLRMRAAWTGNSSRGG